MKRLTSLLLILILAVSGFPLQRVTEVPEVRAQAIVVDPLPAKRIVSPRASRVRKPVPRSTSPKITVRSQPTLTSGGVWARLRQCESGSHGLYRANTGNGYYGAYQFDIKTMNALGYTLSEFMASPAKQDDAARRLQAQRGWQPWPSCRRKLGLP